MNLPLLQTSTSVSWHSSWQTYPSLDQQTENPSWSSRSASSSGICGAVYPFAQPDERYAASIWRAPAAGSVTATK